LSVAGLDALNAGFKEQPSLLVTMNAPGDLALRVHVFQGAWQLASGGTGRPAIDAGEGTVLDFDASKSEHLSSEEIDRFLDQAHGVIEDAFFGVVTPEYQKFMEG
jgi:uncharacterized protein (TIGR04255 family)